MLGGSVFAAPPTGPTLCPAEFGINVWICREYAYEVRADVLMSVRAGLIRPTRSCVRGHYFLAHRVTIRPFLPPSPNATRSTQRTGLAWQVTIAASVRRRRPARAEGTHPHRPPTKPAPLDGSGEHRFEGSEVHAPGFTTPPSRFSPRPQPRWVVFSASVGIAHRLGTTEPLVDIVPLLANKTPFGSRDGYQSTARAC